MAVHLMKTITPLKKHVNKLCSLTFPRYNHLSLRIPIYHSTIDCLAFSRICWFEISNQVPGSNS